MTLPFKVKDLNFQTLFFTTALLFAFTLPLSRAALSIFAILLFSFWLTNTLYTKQIKHELKTLFSSKIMQLLTLYIVFSFVSLLWVDDLGRQWDVRITTFYLFVLLMPPLILRITKEQTQTLLSAFLLGMLVSEIVSYGIYFELWHYKNVLPTNPTPFMEHIEYSVLLAFTSLLLLIRIFNAPVLKSKLTYALFFLTVTGNLFINGGRTGQISFILLISVVFFMQIKHKLKAFLGGLLLLSALLFIAWNFSPNFNSRMSSAYLNVVHTIDSQQYCSPVGARVGGYIFAWETFKENPILGAGWAGHQELLNTIAKTKHPELECIAWHLDMQNQFLFVIAQFGVVGLVLFISLLYAIFTLPLKNKHFNVLRTTFVLLLVGYFFSEGFMHHFILSFFALMVSIFIIQSKSEPTN